MTADLLRCSTCRTFKNLTEFQLTRGDERRGRPARPKKTCNACLDRRRGLYDQITYTSIDYPMSTWTNFLSRLENQIACTELQLKASLPMRDAADSMTNLINEISGLDGFRWFRQHTETFERVDGGLTYDFRCSQRERTGQTLAMEDRQRSRREPETYQCSGRIHIMQRISTIYILYHHRSHLPPPHLAIRDVGIRSYIIQASQRHTAPEIMQQLTTGSLPGANINGLTRASVYNLWLQATSGRYQRHTDPHRSAQLLVEELENMSLLFFHASDDNKPRVALSTLFLAQLVEEPVIECYVDDTKGLEHAGLKLYCIMGLVKGKAVPVSYFICGQGDENLDTTRWIEEWFLSLRDHLSTPLVPHILFSDKDRAQMNAAERVWEEDIIRLCFWHVRDAITRKLNCQTNGQRQQRLTEADLHLLDLSSQGIEVDLAWVRSAGTTSLSASAKDRIIQMIIRHGARHPALESLDFEEIHDECLTDMYRLMRELDRPALFRYLFANWYRRDIFSKWSMAGGPRLAGFIPIGRTTMVVESHWNDLKNRWFGRCYRPRLDFILYTLDKHVLPATLHRLANTESARSPPSWWRAFRNIWATYVAYNTRGTFLTNLMQWTCSCQTFRQSYLLLCPHLTYAAVEAFPMLQHIHYSRIRRHQFPPYLEIDCFHGNESEDSDLRTVQGTSIEEDPILGTTTTLIEQIGHPARGTEMSSNEERMEALPTIAEILDQ